VLRSSQIELRPGTASHPLRGLQHASADATEQIRIRVQFSATLWGRSPFLRAVTLSGGDGLLHWTTAKNWSDGQLEPSLAVDTGESNLQ
jgi:hypothetical protein